MVSVSKVTLTGEKELPCQEKAKVTPVTTSSFQEHAAVQVSNVPTSDACIEIIPTDSVDPQVRLVES